MPITASGSIAFSALRTEMGTSGQVSLSDMYQKMYGIPSASQSNVALNTFYSTVGPIKKVHLDASTLSGSAGTQISTWTGSDSQPNATGVSGTGSTKPTLQSESSKNHVHFDASTQQYFTLPSLTFSFTDGSSNPINGLTVFIVGRHSTTLGLWERFFDFGNGPSADNILVARPGTNANQWTIEIFNGSTYISSQYVTATDNVWYVYAVTIPNRASLTYSFYLNSTLTSSSPVNGSASNAAYSNRTISSNYIGKSNWADAYLTGDIREMIIINSGLTNTQVVTWSNYLKTKWGL